MATPLRAHALRSMGWASLAQAGLNAIRLTSRLLLARLLGPDTFGLFALTFVIVGAFRLACGVPLPRLVHRAAPSRDLLATAHWSTIGLGAVGTLAVVILADPLAALAGHPDVGGLLRGLSPQILLGSLSGVPRAWLWRALAFRGLATRNLLAEGVGALVGLGAALGGAGIWSLIVAELASEAVSVALFWGIAPERHRLHWSRREWGELARFGAAVLVSQGATYVTRQGDRFIVGRLFGPEVLGFYAIAARAGEVASDGLNVIFAQVAIPSFAHLHDDPRRSRRGFLDALRGQALLTTPIFLAMALLADGLVPLVLGAAWLPSVPFLRVIAVRALAASLLALPNAALVGRGRTDRLLQLGLIGLGASLLGWGIGASWGALGVLVGGTAATVLTLLVSTRLVARDVFAGPTDWIRALGPSALGATAMALAQAAAMHVLPPSLRLATPRGLGVGLTVAAVAYTLPLLPWLVWEVPRYVALIRGADGPAPPAPSEHPPG